MAILERCGACRPPISGYSADLLTEGYLRQQAQQNRTVALVAKGEHYSAEVTGGSIHCKINLATMPLHNKISLIIF